MTISTRVTSFQWTRQSKFNLRFTKEQNTQWNWRQRGFTGGSRWHQSCDVPITNTLQPNLRLVGANLTWWLVFFPWMESEFLAVGGIAAPHSFWQELSDQTSALQSQTRTHLLPPGERLRTHPGNPLGFGTAGRFDRWEQCPESSLWKQHDQSPKIRPFFILTSYEAHTLFISSWIISAISEQYLESHNRSYFISKRYNYLNHCKFTLNSSKI